VNQVHGRSDSNDATTDTCRNDGRVVVTGFERARDINIPALFSNVMRKAGTNRYTACTQLAGHKVAMRYQVPRPTRANHVAPSESFPSWPSPCLCL